MAQNYYRSKKAIHDEIDANLNLESAGEEAEIMKTVA